MNIFIIPSWYPTSDNPYTGIFIKEQAKALAEQYPEAKLGISLWGSHKETLLIDRASLIKWPQKWREGLSLEQYQHVDPDNLTEYFSPAFTWTRRFFGGNFNGICKACESTLQTHIKEWGCPNIIHAHVVYPAGAIAMLLGRRYKIPYVITEHMSPFPFATFCGRNGRLGKQYLTVYHNSDKNIAVSNSLKEKMEQRGIGNIKVIPNLTNEDFFNPFEENIPNTGVFTFAFAGRLEPQKGLKFLLEATAVLKRSKPEFKVVIAGNGSQQNYLLKLAKELGVEDRIEWCGTFSRGEIRSLLYRCDALVLPSSHENNPLIILEALAMGKPVIATRCGGPEEILTEESGLVIEPEDAAELARAMTKLMETIDQYDSNLIRSYFLSKFSKKVVTSQLMNLYQQVIANYHP